MNRGILIKAGIVLGAFIVVIGLAFGCEAVKNNGKTPVLKDSDNIFVSIDGIDVTDGELYEEMLLSNGLSYLEQYAEEQLLADYLDKVTDEEILAEKELMTYGTKDPILLAEYKASAEINDQLVETFDETLVLLGLDPSNIDDLRIYLGLSIAKQKYTRDYINGVEDTDPLYIANSDVEEYYETMTKGDICTLDVRFNSTTEAGLVLDYFNIVPNYDGVSWGLYDPTANEDVVIDKVETGGFNDDNTATLTNDEAFVYFIKIWNYMNPNETPIPEDADQATFCEDYKDLTTRVYEDMTRGEQSTSYVFTYTKYLWDTLVVPVEGEDNSSAQYSHKVQTVGEFGLISFKLSEDEVTAFADLDADTVAELKYDYTTTQLSTETLEVAMEELWLENELVIYDPTLKLQSEFQNSTEIDNKGSKDFVATLGTTEISARMLFDYMTENFGMYTAVEVAQVKSLLQSELFDTVYDGVENYLKSDNETMQKHVTDLEGFKEYFASNGFAQAGLSSEDYTWEEFLVLYLQCSSEMDVLEEISIAGNLQSYLLNETINYDAAVDYINDQVENYFSLNVEHLLIYVDHDYNFSGDDYSDYLDGLSVAEKATYDALVADFSNLVQDKVNNDEMTFDEIVTEYQDSLMGDLENEWAPYKAYGFYIITQDLSAEQSLTYANTNGYFDEDFVANVKRAYDAYVIEIDNAATKPDHYNDDRVFESDFGVHYITATEGTGFEQPTAVFEADDDYVAGNVGTTVAPNKAQVELYMAITFSSKISENNDSTLAPSVSDALDAYYANFYSWYWPSDDNKTLPVTVMTVGYALDHNISFAEKNDDRVAALEAIYDKLIEINFPEEYIR